MTVLLKFCSEGDNTQDAIQLALYLNQWKNWVNTSNYNYELITLLLAKTILFSFSDSGSDHEKRR